MQQCQQETDLFPVACIKVVDLSAHDGGVSSAKALGMWLSLDLVHHFEESDDESWMF